MLFLCYVNYCVSREQSNLACFAEMQQCRRRQHLGGTSYLTDQGGQVAQTLAYLPYGENWVDVTAFQYDTSQVGFYQFNGKERDPGDGLPVLRRPLLLE